MDPAAAAALRDAPELELVTRGRASGREHSVRLLFVYDDGLIWVRTDERPPAPDASGVHWRSSRDRDPDWLRNLVLEPSAEVRVGGLTLPVRYESSTDQTSDLRRAVDLMRAKYGSDWVEDWYVDRGRVAVKLRVG